MTWPGTWALSQDQEKPQVWARVRNPEIVPPSFRLLGAGSLWGPIFPDHILIPPLGEPAPWGTYPIWPDGKAMHSLGFPYPQRTLGRVCVQTVESWGCAVPCNSTPFGSVCHFREIQEGTGTPWKVPAAKSKPVIGTRRTTCDPRCSPKPSQGFYFPLRTC